MIIDQIKSKLVEYQKAKDDFKLGALRYFLSEVKNKEIELRPQGLEITDEVVLKIIRKQLKNRNQTLEMFERAGRTDLVEKEKKEIIFLEELASLFPAEL